MEQTKPEDIQDIVQDEKFSCGLCDCKVPSPVDHQAQHARDQILEDMRRLQTDGEFTAFRTVRTENGGFAIDPTYVRVTTQEHKNDGVEGSFATEAYKMGLLDGEAAQEIRLRSFAHKNLISPVVQPAPPKPLKIVMKSVRDLYETRAVLFLGTVGFGGMAWFLFFYSYFFDYECVSAFHQGWLITATPLLWSLLNYFCCNDGSVFYPNSKKSVYYYLFLSIVSKFLFASIVLSIWLSRGPKTYYEFCLSTVEQTQCVDGKEKLSLALFISAFSVVCWFLHTLAVGFHMDRWIFSFKSGPGAII